MSKPFGHYRNANYQKMYNDLLAEFEQYKKESVKWSVEDFLHYNEEYKEQGLFITPERAQEALERMIRKHDAEWGISWQEVEFYFREYALCISEEEEETFDNL